MLEVIRVLCWVSPAFHCLGKAELAACWPLEQDNWLLCWGERAPTSHHRPGKDEPTLRSCIRGSWLWHHTQDGWFQLLDLTCLANTQTHNWTLGWPTAASTHSRSYLSLWRDQSYGTIPARSPRHRISQKSSSDSPVRIQWGLVYQNPEAMNQTKDSCNEELLFKLMDSGVYYMTHRSL